jgi:hypothetical protein
MRCSVLSLSLAGLLLSASGASAGSCVITVSLESGADINNLDFKVDYSATDGNVEGTPTRPDCVRALGNQTLASFHDDDANQQLLVSFVRLSHFSAPTPLVACRFFYDALEPFAGDFSVIVTNAARDGEDNNVLPAPQIAVSDVECPGVFPELTTTTLTDDTTTTTLVAGEERCGFPVSDGEKPAASDALYTLKAAVGSVQCALCVCDVDDSGAVGAGDALVILRAAVGTGASLDCPAC